MADKQPLVQPQPPAPGQQGGYGGPPPAYAPPPVQGGYPQAQHATTVVVTQPSPVVYQTSDVVGDHYFILSVILSFVCFFCGSWWALLCTIPAIFLALNAREAERRGDVGEMQRNRKNALYLNIAALIFGAVIWVIVVVSVIVRVSVVTATYND